mgnify:CR=1 FL=1
MEAMRLDNRYERLKGLSPVEKLLAAIIRGYYEGAKSIIEGRLDGIADEMERLKLVEDALEDLYNVAEGGSFEFWCEIAGLEPEYVRANMEKELGMSIERAIEKLRWIKLTLCAEILGGDYDESDGSG